MTRTVAVLVVVALLAAPVGAAVDAAVPATPEDSAVVYHEGETLTLAAAAGQVVEGRTTLEPGSEVRVQLRSTGGTSPFLKEAEATVDENGEFAAIVNLDDAEPGTSFTVVVRDPDAQRQRLLDDLEGEVVEGDAELGLAEGTVHVRRGSTATLTLVLDAGASATLRVSDPVVGYELTADVSDGDGDGRVVVALDTAVAGTDGNPLSTTAAADEVTLRSETVLDSSLPADRYPVSMTYDGIEYALGSLAVEDPTRTATATPEPTTPSRSGHPELSPTIGVSPRTGTVALTVNLGNASAATVGVGGDDVNYRFEATVRDGDGDNEVGLVFDTGAAGTDRPTATTRSSADEVEVHTDTSLSNPPLEPGEYGIDLYRGSSADGPSVDIGTLIIEDGTPRAPSTPIRTSTPSTTTAPGSSVAPPATSTGPVERPDSTDPGVLVLGAVAAVGLGVAVVLRFRP